MKVSFDFDGTLSESHVQEYAKELVDRGIEVWIVTSRFENAKRYNDFFNETVLIEQNHNDLWEAVENTGIPKEQIHFTNMEDKSDFLRGKGFVWHLDDDWGQNLLILNTAKMPAINVRKSAWKNKCERLLDRSQSL